MSKPPVVSSDKWRSKIVGHGRVAPDQLLAHPENWRIHPSVQQEGLAAAIERVGYIRSVTVNKRTGTVIDGHLRVALALRSEVPEIDVEYVELTEDEERIALLTLDPLAAMADSDSDLLLLLADSLLDEDVEGLEHVMAQAAEGSGVTLFDVEERDPNYTRKIEPPIYEITGERPALSDLIDKSKAKELVQAIRSAEGITDDERAFLLDAAARHVVFDYQNIAEYYAHATPAMQLLMEQSALVIIDFNQAIENGFVRVSKELAEAAAADGY